MPGKLTLATTVVLPLAAVALVLGGVSPQSAPFIERTAEFVAVFCLILAWRFRRSRLFLATGTIALANFLVRSAWSAEFSVGSGPVVAALSLLLPLNLGIITLLPEGKPLRLSTLAFAGAIAAQLLQAGSILAFAENEDRLKGLYAVVTTPQAAQLAFLIATAFILVALAIRRGIFEIGMVGVLGSCALALFWRPGVGETTVFFAAAQLVLLFGLMEDSYMLAFVDGLTGLPGRRAFDEALHGLGGVYTIAMIDVDHFKKFNDRFGHEAGDQALRMLAGCLQMTGGRSHAYRYGGEEFAVIFSSLGVTDAREHLEDLRNLIADRRFSIRSPQRPKKRPDRPKRPKRESPQARLTVSIGAAGPSNRRSESDEVLRAADRALYRAKRSGRNRVVTT
jgi:diguanylate cyclase (GGDEF)-like protein